MRTKIRVEQLRLGMHLHELCGAWLEHPFWRTEFVLRDPRDIEKLRDSGVAECWIDTDKGVGLVEPVQVPPSAVAAVAVATAPTRQAAPPLPFATSMEDESARAAALCHRSRQAVMSLFSEARMGRSLDAEQCLPLVDDIASSVERNPGALISLARLKSHDDYSFMHSVAVCALMVSLARQLGHDDAQVRDAGLAGLLHDLGKAMMPAAVLNKPGPLTDAEYGIMKTHPARGHELLLEGKAVSATALDVCLHHHERPDGKGYPDGSIGEALSLHARMGAVCDVYDAITSNRPYKGGWDPAESIARMAEWAQAGQFDSAVFQAFVKGIGIYPIGSLVRLHSGRLGVVTEQNATSLIAPKLKVFFSSRSRMPVPVEVIDLGRPGCNERIAARESNHEWKFPHLAELVIGQNLMRKQPASTDK